MRCALNGEMPVVIEICVLLGKMLGAIGGGTDTGATFNGTRSGVTTRPFPITFSALSGFTRPFPIAFCALLIVFSALLTSSDISNGGRSDESEMQSAQNFIGKTEAGLNG